MDRRPDRLGVALDVEELFADGERRGVDVGAADRGERRVDLGGIGDRRRRPDRARVPGDRDDVELDLEAAGADEGREVARQVRLVEAGAVRLEEPVPHLVAHAVRRRAHEVRDRRRARARGIGERRTRRVAADLRDVGVVEALPVRLLAVVAARRPERARPVAAVGELGAGADLVAMRVEQRRSAGGWTRSMASSAIQAWVTMPAAFAVGTPAASMPSIVARALKHFFIDVPDMSTR